MKQLKAAIIPLIIVLMLCGCTKSSCTALMLVENSTGTIWNLRYEKLDGTKEKTMGTAKKDDKISCAVTTSSGALTVEIVDSNKNTVYTSDKFTADGGFSYKVKDEGKYTIRLVAENHNGSVDIEIGGNE